MAQSSLIDIIDNKLIFNTKISFPKELKENKNIKVISIIGKARTGKSTFLNCLLTYWRNATQNIFQMSSGGNHCTNGIDVYDIPERGMLLLDFQGIYLGDSSNDPKLLLLAYLLSDVIIFNETKMLSNITLQQFEPMLSFINYMKGKNDLKDFNPKLIFRISDMSLDIDPTTNMQNMLKPEDDQFQAIRECINDLFDNPYAVSTSNLDRKEIQFLKDNQFKELLDIPENGFNDAICKINEYLECCESRKTISIFMDDLPKILKSINDEKAIDFKKLDIVKSLGDIQIRDWIDALGTDIYNDILVDGTSETFKNVVKRQEELTKIIKDLDKTFKSIPKTIRDERSSKLKEQITKKIDKATQENKTMAETLIGAVINKHLLIPNPFTLSIVFDNIETLQFDEWIKPFTDKLELIREQSMNIHNVALLPFCKWKLQVIKDIKQRFDSELEEVKKIIVSYELALDKYFETFNKNIDENIKKYVDTMDITLPYSSILENIMIEENKNINCILQASEDIYHNNKTYKFAIENIISPYNGECNIIHTTGTSKHSNYNNDFNKLYQKFSKEVKNILDTQGNDLIVKYRTEKLTSEGYLKTKYNYAISGSTINYSQMPLIINNKNTQFVEVQYVSQHITSINSNELCMDTDIQYMTNVYYKLTLEPILLRTCEKLYEKGYIYNETIPELNGWKKFLKDITEIIVITPEIKLYRISFGYYKNQFRSDYKRLAMLDIFEHRFKKELIKKL